MEKPTFYICPVCFNTSEVPKTCHVEMISCDAENPEDCKPVKNQYGQYHSRAPLWFVRAVSKLDIRKYLSGE